MKACGKISGWHSGTRCGAVVAALGGLGGVLTNDDATRNTITAELLRSDPRGDVSSVS
jgi:hypothetical protein